MNTIWIVPIEKIEQRYSVQWYYHIPKLIEERIEELRLSNYKVVTIDGTQVANKTTSGAFLDFGNTNKYKASQVIEISERFSSGDVKPGDKFLITDAWNFAITPIKYMSELFEIPVEIHGIWHAGSYDPTDILGMKMTKQWSAAQERSWYYACDYNYFGTEFHKNMFLTNRQIIEPERAVRSGQPYNYVVEECLKYFNRTERTDQIVFTHRLNSDKQPEIFDDLIQALPGHVTGFVTQRHGLSKADYYKMMSESKMVFSCSLHENLGTGMMEGVMCGNIPVVPSRACYPEVYEPKYVYPSEWTQDFDSYLKHKDQLIGFVMNLLNDYDNVKPTLKTQIDVISNDFMNARVMIDNITK